MACYEKSRCLVLVHLHGIEVDDYFVGRCGDPITAVLVTSCMRLLLIRGNVWLTIFGSSTFLFTIV